jgi:DNA-3-methyladenine glycosylase II
MELVTDESMQRGIDYLCARDRDLRSVISKYGNPPLWNRKPGFATLLRIILEQQVSLASAAACYNKLQAAIVQINPENFLPLSDTQLKEIGFSRQKTAYTRNIAELIVSGQLNLDELINKSDIEVAKILIAIRGIGRWTIDIYLLMALQRKDIWPQGDLALVKSITKLKNTAPGENGNDILKLTERWTPWRSVAARILWHYYLSDSSKDIQDSRENG